MVSVTEYFFSVCVFICLAKVTCNLSSFICDEKCSCLFDFTNCSYRSLYNIPHDLERSALNLDLSGNHIFGLNATSFIELTELKYLNISNNKLIYLEPSGFFSLKNLITLDLSHNLLRNFNPVMFMSCSHLKHINISNNNLRIEDFSADRISFKTLELNSLDLSANNLTDLNDNIFSFANSCGSVVLSQNNFGLLQTSSIRSFLNKIKRKKFETALYIDDNLRELRFAHDFFEDLYFSVLSLRRSQIKSLDFMKHVVAKYLDLSDNPLYLSSWKVNTFLERECEELYLSNIGLKIIESPMLNKFTYLKVLDLSRNLLFVLDGQAFVELRSLQRLDLSHNADLKELSIDFGKTLTALNYLNLSSCALHYIDPLIIAELPSLLTLDLSYNKFQTFPNSFKDIFSEVEHVNMSHNPLHCNCELLWLAEWLQENDFYSRVKNPEMFICSSPHKQPINKLLSSDFKCSVPVIVEMTENTTSRENQGGILLRCEVRADPPASVLWMSPSGLKQGVQPSANRTRNTTVSYLKVSQVNHADEGWYVCFAENLIGNVSRRTYLKIISDEHFEETLIKKVEDSQEKYSLPQTSSLSFTKSSFNNFSATTNQSSTLSIDSTRENSGPGLHESTWVPSPTVPSSKVDNGSSLTFNSSDFTFQTLNYSKIPALYTSQMFSKFKSVTNLTTAPTTKLRVVKPTDKSIHLNTSIFMKTISLVSTTVFPSETATSFITSKRRATSTPVLNETISVISTFPRKPVTVRSTSLSIIPKDFDSSQELITSKIKNTKPITEYKSFATSSYLTTQSEIKVTLASLLSSWENKVAIFVATGIACLLGIILLSVLVVVLIRKRQKQRRYLIEKRNAFLRTYQKNGSMERRKRSNSGVLTIPLDNSLDRPKNGFDYLLAKDKGMS